MKKCTALLLALSIALLQSGCAPEGGIYSNYRPIEQLQLIQTLGIDSDGRGGVTLSASSGKPEDSGQPIILCRSAGSILKAMDSLQDYNTRGQLFFAHTQYLVLGRDYAEEGIGELLDFVERDLNTRMSTELFVLRSGTAEALISGPGDASYDITDVLASARQDTAQRGDGRVYSFRDAAVALSEYGAALICALLPADTEGSVFLEAPGISALPDGFGILKDGRLVGFLSKTESQAVNLILENPGTALRSVSDGRGGAVTLEFESDGAELKPHWNADGNPGPFEISVKLRATVAELDTDRSRVTDAEMLQLLSDELAAALRQDILTVLDTAQTLDADFLALGKTLRHSSGKNFSALPESWLPDLEFQLTVDAVIDHNYDMNDPVQMNGGA